MVPDLFSGDARGEDTLNNPAFDKAGWVARHGEDSWKPIVDSVVAALKADGVTGIGATGYCFGAPPALHLAYSNAAQVTVITHPSRLQVPDVFDVRSCPGQSAMHRHINCVFFCYQLIEILQCVESAAPHQQL